MDPLSEVLSLFKPQSCISGGFPILGDIAIRFGKHSGIKCYAMISGECWLAVEGVAEPVHLKAGDCYILPRGLPFTLTTDLSLPPVDFSVLRETHKFSNAAPIDHPDSRYLVGGHFILTGSHAEMLLQSLPPIVHIRKESDRAAMRWSLERMKDELHDPQPGGSLIAQQLAYMMLIQALRLHLADSTRTTTGWLSALADKQMSAAITSMHSDPGHPWTLQSLAERVGMSRSIFALKFKQTVGATPMEYLTRWRMLLAGDRLKKLRRLTLYHRRLTWLRVRECLRQSFPPRHRVLSTPVHTQRRATPRPIVETIQLIWLQVRVAMNRVDSFS
jgi:AraC-like DNA-binding protein